MKKLLTLLLALAMVLSLAACGGDKPSGDYGSSAPAADSQGSGSEDAGDAGDTDPD